MKKVMRIVGNIIGLLVFWAAMEAAWWAFRLVSDEGARVHIYDEFRRFLNEDSGIIRKKE